MTIDLTSLATTIIAGLMSIIGTVFLAWLSSHMKDQAAAVTIGTAVKNALGSVQQAADAGLATHPLQATIPGLSAPMAAGVQYVLNQAGPEMARLGVTPDAIAAKVNAQIGLAKIATATPAAIPAPRAAPIVVTAT